MEHCWKAHGLGNDYLVWLNGYLFQSNEFTSQMAIRICDRHRGIGADGILDPKSSNRADVGLQIWNPDGSKAEKSGNGIRIFAWWWAVIQQEVTGTAPFTVDTGSDVVTCVVEEATGLVTVDMGTAQFEPDQIPTSERVWGKEITMPDGTVLEAYTMGIGNPHCVVFVDNVERFAEIPWRSWGAFLESHPLFPNRINVQFASVTSKGSIEIRIWERGAGETQASGTSSCAVASVAHRLGLVDDFVEMKMPGGVLTVEISTEWQVRLCGPVEEVGRMQMRL